MSCPRFFAHRNAPRGLAPLGFHQPSQPATIMKTLLLVSVVLLGVSRAPSQDVVVEPATPMPPITPDTIAEGKAAFLKRECFKCHGRDGRGGLAGGIEVGPDAWGRIDPAADWLAFNLWF